MSFDLVLRRPRAFTLSETQTAFRRATSDGVEIEGRSIRGRGFELEVGENELDLYVRCAWSFAGDADAQSSIRKAARMLGARVVDPQLEPLDPLAPATPVAVSGGAWGTPWTGGVAAGASTLRGMSLATKPPDTHPALDAIHELFIAALGEHISPNHTFHPDNLVELVCHYARIPARALPFDVVVARSTGHAKGGERTSAQRVFAIVDGAAGWLTSPRSTLLRDDDGTLVSEWRRVVLQPVGRGPARRGIDLDVTERVEDSAIRALRQAKAGNTAPLRAWLCAMTSINFDGRAAEELPNDTLVVEPAVATMRVWVMNAFSPQIESVRLDVTEGLQVRLFKTDERAPPRTDLPEPVGT